MDLDGNLVWGVEYGIDDKEAKRVLDAMEEEDGEDGGVCIQCDRSDGYPSSIFACVKASRWNVFVLYSSRKTIVGLGSLDERVTEEWRETLRAFGAKHGLDVSRPQWMLHFDIG
jgi:hypothetical protein